MQQLFQRHSAAAEQAMQLNKIGTKSVSTNL